MEAILLAFSLGLAAGLSPGPLLTLVVSTSLARGFGAGLRVALRSSVSAPSQASTPDDSMPENVSPSTPAEPPFARLRRYAWDRTSSRYSLSYKE